MEKLLKEILKENQKQTRILKSIESKLEDNREILNLLVPAETKIANEIAKQIINEQLG